MFQMEYIKDEMPDGAAVHSRTAVRGVIYYEGKLLMVRTNRGDYKFPGGGVEEGETPREALRREIREETGYVDVTVGPCIGTALEQNEDMLYPGDFFQMKSFYYICKLTSGRREEGQLDDYEEKLGFHGVFVDAKTAYEANLFLLEPQTETADETNAAGGMETASAETTGNIEKIPWLQRETDVLARLLDSNVDVDKIAMEVYECGQIIRGADRSKACIDEKEGHANFVTSYDKRVQVELQNRLQKLVPEAVFVGEEEDIHPSIEKGVAFIVDPIDGTTNFIKDYHCSAISVGVAVDGERVAGVVYNPYLDEMFAAEKGKGAFLNGELIHVSKQPLSNGVVLFGTAPYYEELSKQSFELAYDYFGKALDIRRSGSAAIDLCGVAAGRAELFFELLLSPWDYAAGSLIVEEAGGRVTTVEGAALALDRPCSLKATNGIVE